MKQHECIAEFKGHKVRNNFKVIVRFFDNKLAPWSVMAYDEVYKVIYTIQKAELYDYVFKILFEERKLWLMGEEMERLFSHMPIFKRHTLKEPTFSNTVCFLNRESAFDLVKNKTNYSKISTLNPVLAKNIDWLSPHTCVDVRDNVSNKTNTLLITLPEYNTVAMGNPEYFDIKDKTR